MQATWGNLNQISHLDSVPRQVDYDIDVSTVGKAGGYLSVFVTSASEKVEFFFKIGKQLII